MTTQQDPDALRLAAPAPDRDDSDDTEPDDRPDLDELFVRWAAWRRTRSMYVQPSRPVSLLGKLTAKGTGRSATGGPDAIASAELMALNQAFNAQPATALDRIVLELHYCGHLKSVKAAAASVGVSRQHWYRLVRACREKVYLGSLQLLEQQLSEGQQLLSGHPHGGSV